MRKSTSFSLILLLLFALLGPVFGQEMVTADQFIAATKQFDIHTLRKLLKQNPQVINELGTDGTSALSESITSRVESGPPEVKLQCVRFLLDQGADPNLRTGDISPLELGMVMDIEIVKMLLNAGADPMSKGEEGISPMDTAEGLKGERAEKIKALLKAKINE